MESTLFTELTVSEQAIVSGGYQYASSGAGAGASGPTFNFSVPTQVAVNAGNFGGSNGIAQGISSNQQGATATATALADSSKNIYPSFFQF
ncbi:MAG: hypothetical protein DSM106950_36635 [Stigonema ocellatum SAG 48.90 = DSM 106950]|nr:hypothetical protein [Stigonema ocellatum SAG 48.90 = DSM 106950]